MVWWWSSAFSQPILSSPQREKLVKAGERYLHVREATGKNDGKDVEAFLRNVGLGKGYAWCAAFMAQCHDDVGLENPRSAYCPVWFRKSNLVYQKNVKTITSFQAKKGQMFGLYIESKGRIGHIGMLTGQTKLSYHTIEGNANGGGSHEGDGVYRLIRNKKSIYAISDYCK